MKIFKTRTNRYLLLLSVVTVVAVCTILPANAAGLLLPHKSVDSSCGLNADDLLQQMPKDIQESFGLSVSILPNPVMPCHKLQGSLSEGGLWGQGDPNDPNSPNEPTRRRPRP